MSVIHKQTLDKFMPTQDMLLPDGSKLLAIGNQMEDIVIWYECDPEADMVTVKFVSANTGEEVPHGCKHLGTVILHGGVYVRHVYVSKT